jgi:hypothetical protein
MSEQNPVVQSIKFIASLSYLPRESVLVLGAEMDDASYQADGKPSIEKNAKLKAAKSVYIYTTKQILQSGNFKQYAYFFVPMDDPIFAVKKS